MPSSFCTFNLEFLPIFIHYFGHKFCISAFYRPNSFANIFDTLFITLAALNISFSHLLLVGHFNVNMNDPSHHLYHRVCSFSDYINFTPVVREFTHIAPCGNTSRIDLVFTSSPPQIIGCATIPSLDNYNPKLYHQGLHLKFNWNLQNVSRCHSHRQIVWDYAHADFDNASQIISETDWNIIFSEDIDVYCAC